MQPGDSEGDASDIQVHERAVMAEWERITVMGPCQ